MQASQATCAARPRCAPASGGRRRQTRGLTCRENGGAPLREWPAAGSATPLKGPAHQREPAPVQDASGGSLGGRLR